MTVEDIMKKLEAMGSEQTKKTFIRHGAPGPLFGVKIGDLKKLVKDVKKDQALARALYETGNSDAMYLAGLTVNPKMMDKETLQAWAKKANWYALAEYTVAGVAAESPYALELAREWMQSSDEMIATCGWSTYANYVSITKDECLDLEEIRRLLQQIAATIHSEKNRVCYTMNMFVIVVGSYVRPLHEEAVSVAEAIGKVEVHMGQTACKVPDAVPYIEKTVAAGKLGTRKKTCIC
ncbi:DNA alkylation repair protein [Paenibacillus dendritiformis]|uniref:DNA alkylation repair protein n=1 Tax=Paenibacillus dendritiformis TaxID=130049 RepID=UPI0010597A51|nr:DNA alkylation repair protein [Paenibacillus dendritiformis]TDL52678.1 DNA alkylation repair protein [Paenibacillus dendritiformis]